MYTLPPEWKMRDRWSRFCVGVRRFWLTGVAAGLLAFVIIFLFWKFGFAAAISGTFQRIFALPEDWAGNNSDKGAGQAVSEAPPKKNSAAKAGAKRKTSSKPKASPGSGSPKTGKKENNVFAPPAEGTNSGTAPIAAPAEHPDCDFSKIGSPNHKILFSEIAWVGGRERANDEWIELKNNSGMDLRLVGWRIASGDGNIKIIFESGDMIAAGAYFLLKRTEDNFLPDVSADKIYSGALSNKGEHLKLFDAECALVDEIDASNGWPAGDSTAKKTMERSSLDLTWHTSGSVGGTPKSENTAAFSKGIEIFSSPPADQPASGASANSENSGASSSSAPAAPVKILINVVQITGGSGKSNSDFIELYNPGNSAADVSGWQLKKRTTSDSESSIKVFPSGARINARGYFMWANSDAGFASSTGADVSSGAYLADNNSIGLFDKSSGLIDALAWGSGHLNPFVEGSPYPDNPGQNQALRRRSGFQDTDNNAADFEIK